jgi:hypothetical protein
MESNPKLDYEPPKPQTNSEVVVEAGLSVITVVLSLLGVVPLILACMMTYGLLFEDVPTRDFWGFVFHTIVWWLLTVAMYWPALRMITGRR